MSGHVLQCVWPVTDDTYTRSELIAEAGMLIDRLAEQANAVVTGPPLWYIADAAKTPGWHAHAPGSVLVAVMPAEPYGDLGHHRTAAKGPDPAAVERIISGNPPARQRDVDRRTAIAALITAGVDTAAIAGLLGVKTDAVHQAAFRRRHLVQA